MKTLLVYCLSAFLQLAGGHAAGQVAEEFGELIYYIPTGLTVTKTPNKMVLSDGQGFSITVNKSTYSLKKTEKALPGYWRETLLSEGVDDPDSEPRFVKAQTNSGWNWYRGGKLIKYHENLPSVYYHLTVMKYLGITLLIVTQAESEEQFLKKSPLLVQLVSSIIFKPKTPTSPFQPALSDSTHRSSVYRVHRKPAQLKTPIHCVEIVQPAYVPLSHI